MENNHLKGKKDSSMEYIFDISLNFDIQSNESPNYIKLTVFLKLAYHKESFKISVTVSTIKEENSSDIKFCLGEVIDKIFGNLGKNFISNYFLSYYLNNEDETEGKKEKKEIFYQYLGGINIKNEEYHKLYFKIPKDKTVYLKLTQKIGIDNFCDPLYLEENELESSNPSIYNINLKEEEEEEKNDENKGNRGKEKTIEYAIIKVFLYNTIREKSNCKISQADVAKMIHISKKTLDDYKKKILIGIKYHFNFGLHYKKKMNFLIDFVNEKDPDEKEKKRLEKEKRQNKKIKK